MVFKKIRSLSDYFSFDQDYHINIAYLKEQELKGNFNNHLHQLNLHRITILSGFVFFLSLYNSIMDYFPVTTDVKFSLTIYRIIDPVFTLYCLIMNMLARYVRIKNLQYLYSPVVNVFSIVAITYYAFVSSVEQFDFNHHPSFVFSIIIMSMVVYKKPLFFISTFIYGLLIIQIIPFLMDINEKTINIFYSITIFAGPLSIITSKINYNHFLRQFVDEDKKNKLNVHLEEEVKSRTSELEETNKQLQHQIDKQKEYEVSLQKSREDALRSDSLKSAFLNNLSHEIRTPLNSIGFSSLLTNPKIKPEKIKRYTGLINSCGKELVYIIDQLVEISRIQTGAIEVTKSYIMVNDLLFEMQELTLEKIRELNKEDITFAIKNPFYDKNLRIYNDLIKIKNIFFNLIDNAVKFTESGKIEIGVDMGENNSIVFCVIDTGIGISEKDKEILFEQFTQVDSGFSRRYGGLGIGLSISKTYSEVLGGRLWFDSKENEGSVFYFAVSK